MALTFPSGGDPAAVADWTELHLAATRRRGLSVRTIDLLLRGEATDAAEAELRELEEELGALDEDAEAQEDDPTENEVKTTDEADAERDVRVELLFEEIELRLRVGPHIYPFQAQDEQILDRDVPGKRLYLLWLILSSTEASYRPERRAHEVEAAYDLTALSAMRRYLGPQALGVRFAKNSHDPDDADTRPRLFSDAIRWLRDRLDLGPGVRRPEDDEEEPARHWEFVDEQEELGREPLNSYKDAGADVVAWRPFLDGRGGFPVLLAQCTVQLDWAEKVSDVKLELWMKWIDFDTVPPQKALVIPFAIHRTEPTWRDRTVSAGVIFDRLRLMEMLDDLGDDELAALVDPETLAWVEREFSSLA